MGKNAAAKGKGKSKARQKKAKDEDREQLETELIVKRESAQASSPEPEEEEEEQHVVEATEEEIDLGEQTAAIVEGENGEQRIYIIQGSEGEAVQVEEGSEVVVSGDVGVIETVSALEQLSRGGGGVGPQIVTAGGELLQVYEEVVLPDGSSAAKMEDDSCSSSRVGSLTVPTLSSAAKAAVDPTTGAEFHICRICNQFVTMDMMATHNAQAHGHIRDLTCMDCGKLFKSKRSLFGHRKEKHSGMLEVHACPECGKSFGRKSNLKAHRESLHYGKKFPCVYCDRIFTNRSSMNQHIKKTHNAAAIVASAAAAASSSSGADSKTVILHPLAAT